MFSVKPVIDLIASQSTHMKIAATVGLAAKCISEIKHAKPYKIVNPKRDLALNVPDDAVLAVPIKDVILAGLNPKDYDKCVVAQDRNTEELISYDGIEYEILQDIKEMISKSDENEKPKQSYDLMEVKI